jgi:cytochrome b
MAGQSRESGAKVLVWDFPTRVFHWSLVILVLTSFFTGMGWSGLPSENWVHQWSGIFIMVLLFFRIVWGFVGGRHARFTDFIKGPSAVLRYAKGLVTGAHEQWRGHNPVGGLSVIAMLGLLTAQVGTGLFANDDSDFEAPLFELVGKDLSDTLTSFHYDIIIAIYVVIAVHVSAIIFYRFKGEHLVAAMLHGHKEVPDESAARDAETDGPADGPKAAGNLYLALGILAVSIGLAVWIINL